jgi:hypothetical protein
MGSSANGIICTNCERGREACEWCHDLEQIDYETICDCGLETFGAHLLDCKRREGYRWVVACDYPSAGERL